MQKEIEINNVKIPIIEEGGEKWYPISYIGDKILLKTLNANQLNKNGYDKHIQQYEIFYGEDTGGIQNTYCINEIGLKELLNNSKIGRLSKEQKIAMNYLLKYLHMKQVITDERFIDTLPEEELSKYSEYIQDCINEVLENDPNTLWQQCTKCNNYYPYHENFFKQNPHHGKDYELYTICRDCNGWSEQRGKDYIRLSNKELSRIYRKFGKEVYGYYKNKDVLNIYKHWITTDNQFPTIINNEENKLLIIKYLYDNKYFDKYDDLTANVIQKVSKIPISEKNFIKNIHKELFGCYFVNDVEFVDDIETAKNIFFNYIKNNNIIVNNVYTADYTELFKQCKLRGYLQRKCNNNMLTLIMELYDNKYGAYKFNVVGNKYWDLKENRDLALKFLIEQDMKIPIEKIPLYLTLENMRKQSNTLRNLLRKYYDNNIWLWVNELYPNRFDEEDFNVTVIRNIFDSAEESMIHDILISKFKNVLYNQRNTKNTITIEGMQPDWFIFTNNGVYVVEYFGIDIEQKVYNKRISDYKNKAESKINKYKMLSWLRTVYIYPDDLKENYKGLEEKLKAIE